MVKMWLLLLLHHLVTACCAEYHYALGCPPRHRISNPEGSACRLTLSAAANVSTSVQISTVNGTDPITLQPGDAHVQLMDQSFSTDNGVQDKGIVIVSDEEVYCSVEYVDLYDSPPLYIDSTQIMELPEDQEQYTHYLVSYKRTSSGGCASWMHSQFYTIAAAESDTQVEIYTPGGDGPQQSVTLDRYQTFTNVTSHEDNPRYDPTGMRVVSNKPVSVLSGALCELNGEGGASFITSVQPEAQQQGSDFVAPVLGNSDNSTGYTLRVIAHEDNTRVTVNGEQPPHVVDQGEFVHVDLPGRDTMSTIHCDQPCSAYMATKGLEQVAAGSCLLSLVPTDAMYTHVHFTMPGYEFPHFLAITAEGEAPYDDILLDGQSLADETWTVFEGFSSTWFSIASGSHWLRSPSGRRLAAYVYGHSGKSAGGYGHSIWPGADHVDITTTSAATTDATTTVTAPRVLPTYLVVTNGTAWSPDGQAISPLCAARHTSAMGEGVLTMAAQVNGMIGATLCVLSPDMEIEAASSNLSFDADKASVTLEYALSVQQHHGHADIDACAAEVAAYVTDHAHWQHPILPGSDGCPQLEFDPEEFHHRGSFWECQAQTDERGALAAAADNSLLYSHKVYDVLDTADGSSLSQACADQYVVEWRQQVSSMASTINQQLEQGLLCDQNASSVTNYLTSFSSLGNQAVVVAEFLHAPADVTFAAFFRCSDAALAFSLSRASWGQPFLPQVPGCPRLLEDGDTLIEDQQKWRCL